jgi:hypothetical protein
VAVLSVLSDWGFSVFIFGFIYCYCTLQYPKQALKWFIKYIGFPSAVAFLLYIAAVINVVGMKVFMIDFIYSYLYRVLGIFFGSNFFLQAGNHEGFDNIITWANLISENITLFSFFKVMNSSFDELIWFFKIVVFITLAGVVVQKILQMQMKWWWWVISIFAVQLNINHGASFIIYLVILLPIFVRLNYLVVQYQDNRMKDLAFAVLIALFFAATIFPGYTINFLFIGGRSPMPILPIIGSALVVVILNARARSINAVH